MHTRKRTVVTIDPKIHYQLKLYAIEQGKSLEAVANEALADWMKKNPVRKIVVTS